MKKIYLIIAGAFLIILIIISIILSFGKKSGTKIDSNTLFPTSVPRQGFVSQQKDLQNDQSLSGDSQKIPSNLNNLRPDSTGSTETKITNQNLSGSSLDISLITPVETEDFKLRYSTKLNKIVIEKKTSQAIEQFQIWARKNQMSQLIDNPSLTLIVDSGQNPDSFNPLIEFLNIFMNFSQGDQQYPVSLSLNIPSPTSPITTNNQIENNSNQSRTYYNQSGNLGSLPLPNGCNLSKAGCGPTTVAMIASSYLGNYFTPKVIVDIYKSRGYLLGCNGSYYSDAKKVLQSLGLKTTDSLFFNTEKADTVVPDLRKYLAKGWTFFALANFCNKSDGSTCGHMFWITDIDSRGNILAYDPAYGPFEIPYNENSRYPYPLYRAAFGVKK